MRVDFVVISWKNRLMFLQMSIPILTCVVWCSVVHKQLDSHWRSLSRAFAQLSVDHPVRKSLNVAQMDLMDVEPRLVVFGVQPTFRKLLQASVFIGVVALWTSPDAIFVSK